jgi:hypothetical protein
MSKVKPCALLLTAIIGTGNNRLEQLALVECPSIDLTLDYYYSPYEMLIKEWLLYILPHILNFIRSITINLKHLPRLYYITRIIDAKSCVNLKQLKIMAGCLHKYTGTPYTISKLYLT